MFNETYFMEMSWQKNQQTDELTLESLTSAFMKRFKDNHVDIPSVSIEKWMRDWVPVERYIQAIRPVDSYATKEEKEKYFVSLLLCFTIDFKASIEDTKNAFYDGEDDHLLLLLIIYAELFVANMHDSSHFAVKHACIIDEHLHEFYNAAKELLTKQGPTLLSPGSNCLLQQTPSTDKSISVILIYNILLLLLPQSKADRFKIYHAKIQNIPFFVIADTMISLDWRCEMVSYIVENRLVWEKDVDSDVFLTHIFKPCLDGLNVLVLQLDLHTDTGVIQLLKSMLFIYLLIETYDIDRLFKILKGVGSSCFEGDLNGNSSYFGFLDALPLKHVYPTDSGTRRTLVRTRSVSNLQTHSLNMPMNGQENTVTSFTCFMNLLMTCAELIYTHKDELMANPCAFQEICRLLYCSVSVLLFSLLTCLGNLSSSVFPLSLANFNYILRCGLLFAGANPLGKSTELEYQAACLLYHLDKIVHCRLNEVAHQKLELIGFVGNDKLRNTREFLFKPVNTTEDIKYNNNVCAYFGILPDEIKPNGIVPLPIRYTSTGSLYLSVTTFNSMNHADTFYSTQKLKDLDSYSLLSLRTRVHSAIQFVIFHVAQYENTIISDLFYTKTAFIKILAPQFSTTIIIISEYLSHEKLSINKSLSDLFSTKFIQSIVLLLYAYSIRYSKQFFNKNDLLYNQRYNLISLIVRLLLDLLFILPHETTLSTLLYRPELCLLPTSLLSIFQNLSCPKQIHLHMPLLLLVVDLLNEFIYRLTRYTANCTLLSSPSDNDIFTSVEALASSTDFAESVVKLVERLITREWASIGRNCSVIVELLLLGLIEYFYISQKGATMLAQQREIANHIIKFLKSITLHRQSTMQSKSDNKNSLLSFATGDRSFLMSSRVVEILMSILFLYKSNLIDFIKSSHNVDILKHIIGMLLSNFPRSPYSRCRHLPFLAYVFIYGYSNKPLAHMAGSVIWTFANYLMWPSAFLHGFLDAFLILRTCRHSFGLYNLLLHQFVTGILGRGSLDRLFSFPSVLQLKMISEPRTQFDNVFELEFCAPYANQQEIEPLLCRMFAIEYLFSSFRTQKVLSTWQSVQILAMPSLSIKDIHSVNLPDALFNIRENKIQTKRSSYMQKFKQFFARTFCLGNVDSVKQTQSFASVCSLRSHIMYILNRTRHDPLLPLILLFIVLHTTCNLKNWIYEIAGWTTAYECISIFTDVLQLDKGTVPAVMKDNSYIDLRYKYLHLLVDLLEELLLNGFHSLKRLAMASGVLRFIHDSIEAIGEKSLSADYKTTGLSSTNMHYANQDLVLNIAALFINYTGYLDLLLTFLTTENVMETIKGANINPLKLVFVLTTLLEHLQLMCTIYPSNTSILHVSPTAFKTLTHAPSLLVKMLAEMCILSNEYEYIHSILSSECSDVPNFTILKSITEKSSISVYQYHKTKGEQQAILTSTPLPVKSFEIEKSHAVICHQLKKYFKDSDVIRWLFKSKWSLYHAARSSNIVVCVKCGFEFYYTQLSNPGFKDFLCSLLHYFRSLYDSINIQWDVFSKKITNHNKIFSQIEIDCSELLGLSNYSLIDLILHILKISLSTPSLMDNSILLLEILSFISPLSSTLCQPNGALTYEDMQVMGTILQLSLQSHNPCEFERGYMAVYGLVLNLFTLKETDCNDSNCTMVSRSDLSTQYDLIFQEDTGLKLLFANDFVKLPLSISLIPIATLRFMLEYDIWDDYVIALVIILVKFIFSQEQRLHQFNIFLLSKVCFQFFNDLIATNLIKSYHTKIEIINVIVENIESISVSECFSSDMSFSVKYDAFMLCLHAVIYNLQQDIQKNAFSNNNGDIAILPLNITQQIEKPKESIEAYSFVEEVLHDKDDRSYDYKHLIQVLANYRAKCALERSSIPPGHHETISIPSQMQHPNQHTFEDLVDESSALSP